MNTKRLTSGIFFAVIIFLGNFAHPSPAQAQTDPVTELIDVLQKKGIEIRFWQDKDLMGKPICFAKFSLPKKIEELYGVKRQWEVSSLLKQSILHDGQLNYTITVPMDYCNPPPGKPANESAPQPAIDPPNLPEPTRQQYGLTALAGYAFLLLLFLGGGVLVLKFVAG
ncbi:hypothetical protein A2W14_06690 [Candidatus Gottesmanbacteria bacterium RBG_16_37_8]|uniref:Uncharacterized protein n=1 Tax=Candidatus Gottesmanbacteria bacterium RBG_16_37_8 TaxID=1798371 RepID=A0A1F5YRR5_9BACT|nr:MAG: hypothetical protein A2W14_06690 [Candidatus Gottesmanbacteria bacterium RBG_16_37_8]